MELVESQRQTDSFDSCDGKKRMKIATESKYESFIEEKVEFPSFNSLKTSIKSLEDLSNELLYEIFNYLDVYHVYQGFYSLNQRLQNLMTHSTLPLNINLLLVSKSNHAQFHQQMLMPNNHRILSLRLSDVFLADLMFSSVRITSNFTRLETLIFDHCESKFLPIILHHLTVLPCLSSLIIVSVNHIFKSVDLYHAIFGLPVLKYCKVLLQTSSLNHFLPLITKRISPIEQLIVHDVFSLEQLNAILSCVPDLRHLSVQSLAGSGNFQKNLFSCKLNNLTNVSAENITIPFKQFQLISTSLFSQLEVLRLSTKNNQEYIDAEQWEQLILFAMPKLHIFDFQSTNYLPGNTRDCQLMYDSFVAQFSTVFWLERGWIFTYRCSVRSFDLQVIFYSTVPRTSGRSGRKRSHFLNS